MSGRRAILVAGLVVVLVAVGLVSGAPDSGEALDPTSGGRDGARGLVELVERYGATVEIARDVRLGPAGVAVVLRDRMDDTQREALRRWVGAGGTLVVAADDPALVPWPVTDVVDPPLATGTCSLPDLGHLGGLDTEGIRLFLPGDDRFCFGDETGAAVVRRSFGHGQVVGVGSARLWDNTHLADAGNAALAVELLAPTGTERVHIVEATARPGSGDESLLDLVPSRVRQGLVQLLVAFVVFALYRARRLGRPVSEDQPVQVEGSQLVEATATLLRRTTSTDELRRRAGLERADSVGRGDPRPHPTQEDSP